MTSAELARQFMSRWDSPDKDLTDDERDLADMFDAVRAERAYENRELEAHETSWSRLRGEW